MKQFASSLLILLLTGAPAYAGVSSPSSYDDRARELQKERERLARENDPVDRAKIGIKISDLLLENVADSVREGNLEGMQMELAAYTSAIESAHQTLVDSGRNGQKKSSGFVEFEIALRKQVRKFDDYARMLATDRRGPIEQAKKLATGIQNKLLKAIFP